MKNCVSAPIVPVVPLTGTAAKKKTECEQAPVHSVDKQHHDNNQQVETARVRHPEEWISNTWHTHKGILLSPQKCERCVILLTHEISRAGRFMETESEPEVGQRWGWGDTA